MKTLLEHMKDNLSKMQILKEEIETFTTDEQKRAYIFGLILGLGAAQKYAYEQLLSRIESLEAKK